MTRFRQNNYATDEVAVLNSHIEKLKSELIQSYQKLNIYKKQAEEANGKIVHLTSLYNSAMQELKYYKSEGYNQEAISKANRIINTAQQNADNLLRDAMQTAKIILKEIERVSFEMTDEKEVIIDKLENIYEILETMKIEAPPLAFWGDSNKR